MVKFWKGSEPIFFHFHNKMAVTSNTEKLISVDSGRQWLLYDLINDPSETHDMSAENVESVEILKS